MKLFHLSKRVQLEVDTYNWSLLPTIHAILYGNRHKLYLLSIMFLCFTLYIDICEDSINDN